MQPPPTPPNEQAPSVASAPTNPVTTQTISDETIKLLTSALIPILTEANKNLVSSLSERLVTQQTTPRNNTEQNQVTTNIPQMTQLVPNSLHIEVNPTINLPTFDGTNDVIDFINSFKSAAMVNNWSNERQVAIIQAYLRGQAYEFVAKLTIEERSEINNILSNLKKKFLNNSLCLNEFYNITPEAKSSIRSFAAKLSNLLRRAMPDMDETMRESLLKNRIINSLPQNEQQLAKTLSVKANWEELVTGIELIMPNYPMYIEQTSNSIEINRTEAKIRHQSTDDESDSSQHRETYKNKEYRYQKKPPRPQPPSTGRMNIQCHNCSGFGHVARQCPSTSSNRRTNAYRSQSRPKYSQVNTFSLKGSELYRIQIQYKFTSTSRSQSIRTLIDSGATHSIINYNKLSRNIKNEIDQYLLSPETSRHLGFRQSKIKFEGAFGSHHEEICVLANLKIRIGDWCGWHSFIISKKLGKEHAILGADFLNSHDYTKRGNRFVISMSKEKRQLVAVMNQFSVIPPYSETLVDVKAGTNNDSDMCFEPFDLSNRGIILAKSVNKMVQGKFPVSAINYTDTPIKLSKNLPLGMVYSPSEIYDECAVNAFESSNEEKTPMPEDILQKLNINKNLNENQKNAIGKLLSKYSNVVSQSSSDLGRTQVTKHRVDTGDHLPLRSAPYHAPQITRERIETCVDEMLAKDIIEESHSPWASPVVLVKKKDGTFRFCVDFRKLNRITRRDAYPLPRIDDVVDMLEGSCYFSTIDTIAGYWQVEMDEQDKEKTAFVTQRGLYQFKVMPFGLSNAPGTFQRLMDKVLKGLNWKQCVVYLDDIVIFSKSFEEHLERLEAVLKRLQQAKIKIQPSKCNFCMSEVNFLGFKVSKDGLLPNQERVATIANLPPPQSVTETKRFLGFVSYYRRFIKNLSKIAEPLFELCKKNCKFKWTSLEQNSFDRLKNILCSAPILRYANPNQDFILQCDASSSALGAVLSQQDIQGKEHPIAYASRTLSTQEKRYSNTEREALAIQWSMSYFRHYLYGKFCKVYTDHQPLVTMDRMKTPDGKLATIFSKLENMGVTYSLHYRNAKANKNADVLSRINMIQIAMFDWKKEQSKDSHIRNIYRELKDGEAYPGLRINDRGIVVRNVGGREQIMVPDHLKAAVCRLTHDHPMAGHLGRSKTLKRVRDSFYWTDLSKNVENYVKNCPICQINKSGGKHPKAPLEPIFAFHPFQKLVIDITGPLRITKRGNRYIIVVTDLFTKFCITMAVPNFDAETTAKFIFERICCEYGFPEIIMSDQGPNFESALVEQLCKFLNISKLHSTAYRPQTQGGTEKQNDTIKTMLRCFVNANQDDWDEYLPQIVYAYNTAEHAATETSPFMALRGTEPRKIWEFNFSSKPESLTTYVSKLQERQKEVNEFVSQKNAKAKLDQVEHTKTMNHVEYKEGDLVLMREMRAFKERSKSLTAKFNGPYRVTKVINDQNLEIEDKKGFKFKIHYDHLKLFHSRPGEVTELAVKRGRGRPSNNNKNDDKTNNNENKPSNNLNNNRPTSPSNSNNDNHNGRKRYELRNKRNSFLT
jgi:hypothetical protein